MKLFIVVQARQDGNGLFAELGSHVAKFLSPAEVISSEHLLSSSATVGHL